MYLIPINKNKQRDKTQKENFKLHRNKDIEYKTKKKR